MKKYPSIEQFRQVIRKIREQHDYKGTYENGSACFSHKENYPTLKFKGTVKLHGTNSAVVKYKDRVEYQSRQQVLSISADNAGFMNEISKKDTSFLFDGIEFNDYIAVYGEWCGGSIQKGVALNQVPKMFVIFGVKVDDNWVDLNPNLHDNSQSIYNVLQFKTYEIDIDFNQPELVQNDIIAMTIEVETKCPVGEFFGVDGIGEGIVFTCVTDQDLKFKSKGEKHSASKVKKISSVNVDELNSITEFVEYAVTTNRLEQGLMYLTENGILLEPKNTGDFLSWVVHDVLKEESDTIKANILDDKKLKSAIVQKARSWFLTNVNS